MNKEVELPVKVNVVGVNVAGVNVVGVNVVGVKQLGPKIGNQQKCLARLSTSLARQTPIKASLCKTRQTRLKSRQASTLMLS